MDATNFAVEAQVEECHWWFAGRRALFGRELAGAGLNSKCRVLDVGTGTGGNLRMLRNLQVPDVTGLDSNDLAIAYCKSKGLGAVRRGDICALPFADRTFDFVLATDVIEHVDDDSAALGELARVLRPGGKVLIAVPAFESLMGAAGRCRPSQTALSAATLTASNARGRPCSAPLLLFQLSIVRADLGGPPVDRPAQCQTRQRSRVQLAIRQPLSFCRVRCRYRDCSGSPSTLRSFDLGRRRKNRRI